ncbi:HalOD1 output domain-containing protein [Halostagnicola bangensis]
METTLSGPLETRSNSQPLSVQLVRKIAEKEGIDPTELDAPLYDVINPEALNELFEPRRNGESRCGTVEFTYQGYQIVVEQDDSGGGPTITLEESGDQPLDASGGEAESDGDSVPDASHYCLDCDWMLPADDEYSTSDRSGLAITHHVETGHTIEANDSTTESTAPTNAVEELSDASDEKAALAATDDSIVTN